MNRLDLLNALEIVKPGLATSTEIEQAKSFIFKGGYVTTFNDSISVRHPVKGVEINGAVNADELLKLLAKIKKKEIKIETSDTELRINAGRSKAGFSVVENIRLPIDEVGDVGRWRTLPKDFKKAIRFTMFTCASELSKPALTCIYVSKDGNVMSSDDRRITIYRIDKMPTKTFLLPKNSARELVKYDFSEISKSSGWVHFRNDAGTVFSCRVYGESGRFKDFHDIVDVHGVDIEFPVKETLTILDRAMIFTEKTDLKDEEIEVTFSKNRVAFRAQRDTSWFEEYAKIKYKGDKVSLTVNPTFLKDMIELGTGKDKSVTIGSNKNRVSSMLFKGDCWFHFAMLKVCDI